ncbi:MAG: enoyl-ACP reductase [Planctomycetes bacterium]|nr:enoyl-ACP reductase [Planctomycetota bacterium]
MLLSGKNAVVFGVANKRSLAWAISKAFADQGAKLLLTYQGDRLKENVLELAGTLPGTLTFPCDVTDDAQLAAAFDHAKQNWGGCDIVAHCVAYANREDLSGDFVKTSRDGYRVAQEVSSYSLTAMCRAALPLLEARGGGSVITLTYMGSERVVPNYNVMGVAKAALEASVRYLAVDLGPKNIRVNAISAGPVKTLSAAGISGFSSLLEVYEQKVPLRRNIEAAEVGDTAVFLASPLSRGITGEVIHVDSGYHVLGV